MLLVTVISLVCELRLRLFLVIYNSVITSVYYISVNMNEAQAAFDQFSGMSISSTDITIAQPNLCVYDIRDIFMNYKLFLSSWQRYLSVVIGSVASVRHIKE